MRKPKPVTLHFDQMIRERTLKLMRKKSPREKADALNLVEAIIDGEMSPDDIVNSVLKGKGIPGVYRPVAKPKEPTP